MTLEEELHTVIYAHAHGPLTQTKAADLADKLTPFLLQHYTITPQIITQRLINDWQTKARALSQPDAYSEPNLGKCRIAQAYEQCANQLTNTTHPAAHKKPA